MSISNYMYRSGVISCRKSAANVVVGMLKVEWLKGSENMTGFAVMMILDVALG